MPVPTAIPPATQIDTAVVRVSSVPSPARLSLRARGDLAPLEAALGLTLPRKIGETAGDMPQVTCLGPDEWLFLATDAAPLIAACAGVETFHSLVDISAREVTFVISGAKAADLMTIGLARDIAGIKVGSGQRTLFDSATVVLWRDAPDRFRIDVWNSFAPHILHLLKTGARELAAETA